ncbi:hypothetical protein ACFV6B_13115 [Streptomyces microflavus]|uniref:hypothetical protein n=1 Tax=Streptomyces microflavus TaxID=1919 RepID=UPI0036622CB9
MEHFTANGYPDNHAPEVTGKLATCKRCGDDKLGWKQSSRTGGWYLCDVLRCGRYTTHENPVRRYFLMARTPHKCTRSSSPVK